jgi:ABC-2 type transport system ATP-binding protein
MPTDSIIEVHDLTRYFGDFIAVDHLTFALSPGQVVGFLGPNGSGKTTTLRMLLGLLRPSEGWARVLGFDAARQSDQVRALTGYMSQKFGLYQELTVQENLEFYAGIYNLHDPARLQHVLVELGLEEIAGRQVRQLSAGWRQGLALATAIVHRPRLLLLDEPTSGVDPSARRAFWDLIYNLAEEGITILVSTHYMDEAEYCHQVGILQRGRLLALNTPAALKHALPGKIWELTAAPLLPALDLLAAAPGVLRVSLASDRLRVLADAEVRPETLRDLLTRAHIEVSEIAPDAAGMEDVFNNLL